MNHDTPPLLPLSDDELLAAFEARSLPPGEISHETHVRLAWTALRRYPLAEALTLQTEGLLDYVRLHGAERKYHATITWAYLLIVRERIERAPQIERWSDFAAANPDLLASGSRSVLYRYYSKETLDSDRAKRSFVFPELSSSAATCCEASS